MVSSLHQVADDGDARGAQQLAKLCELAVAIGWCGRDQEGPLTGPAGWPTVRCRW
jgi:hypothetical protein